MLADAPTMATVFTSERMAEISRLSGVTLTRPEDRVSGGVVCATATEFKGLEAHAVVVVDVDDLDEELLRRHLYVACTRARVHLTVMLRDGLHDYYTRGAAWFGATLVDRSPTPLLRIGGPSQHDPDD